jgi:hypothetical protein
MHASMLCKEFSGYQIDKENSDVRQFGLTIQKLITWLMFSMLEYISTV